MLAVLCALASSLLYAFASVLQQRSAAAQPREQSMRVGLLVLLVQRPAWLIGSACDVGGYALQFVALGNGPLVLVQPLLVCGILFALPIAAAWAGRRLGPGDWLAAVMVCAGLGVFLAVADPARGRDNTHPRIWVLLLLSDAALTAVLVWWSRSGEARRRAFFLSAAAGVAYGAAAALTKTTAHLLGRGLLPTLSHWQPYVLLAFGLAGMVIGQSAFQAGELDVSLPAMSVGDPIISIAIGALVFHEALAASAPAVAAEVVSLIVMSAGVYLLARAEAHIEAEVEA